LTFSSASKKLKPFFQKLKSIFLAEKLKPFFQKLKSISASKKFDYDVSKTPA